MERDTLMRWARRATTAQALASRSKIVLACAESVDNKDVAARLEGLSDEQVESVIVKTLEERPPNGDTHWSTRGMSQTATSRIWRAFGLKPHLVDTWKLSTDPQFVEKVRDIVGLDLAPPEKALVLCVDEKS